VGAGGSANVTWPVDSNGYDDVIITATTSDGLSAATRGGSLNGVRAGY
jgi:hypothetical protein